MRRWYVGAAIILAAAAVAMFVPARGTAQDSGAAYSPRRTADGRPDLEGVWQVLNTAAWDIQDHSARLGVPAGHGVVEGNEIPYQPWALAKKQENFEHRDTLDPETKCHLPGLPRLTYMPYPFRIVQQPERIAILHEYLRAVRYVYLNGNPHPEGHIDWYLGDSRGRWDGNSLVVDVVDFNNETWFDRAGNFHSEELHLVERFTPTGPDHLQYEVTIEDPKVFTRPWKMSMPLYRRQEKDAELLEYDCGAYLLKQEWSKAGSPLFEQK